MSVLPLKVPVTSRSVSRKTCSQSKGLFSELDAIAPTRCDTCKFVVIFFQPPTFAADLPGRSRTLVVHPANPPFLLRIVEVVPAPFTSPEVANRTSPAPGGSGDVVRQARKRNRRLRL